MEHLNSSLKALDINELYSRFDVLSADEIMERLYAVPDVYYTV